MASKIVEKIDSSMETLVLDTHDPDKKVCNGLVYRGVVNHFISADKLQIVMSKSVRLLKRDSCQGCEKCGWMMEYLQEDIECLEALLTEVRAGWKYRLIAHWHPGPWEYPQDGETELELVAIENNHGGAV